MSSKYGFQKTETAGETSWEERQRLKRLELDRKYERLRQEEEQRAQRCTQAAQSFNAMVRDVLGDFLTAHEFFSEALKQINGPIGRGYIEEDAVGNAEWSLEYRSCVLPGDISVSIRLYFGNRYQPLKFRVDIDAEGLPCSGRRKSSPTKQGLVDALKEFEKPKEYKHTGPSGHLTLISPSGAGEVW